MKIVFFGSPDSAVHSLRKICESNHRVELVITQPDKPAGRGKEIASSPVKRFARSLNIPVHQPLKIRKDPETLEKIKEIDPDINVIVAYGQIIPSSIIYQPRCNSINLHFSLLPKYRGASPVHWSILNGETTSGVTIFELNEKMDEGDILAQRKLTISPTEYAHELEARMARIGAELLCETIDEIETVPHIKQDHSQATYAPLLKKEDGKIDWTKRADEIDRKIRAFTPWPSAFTYFGQKRIKIIQGEVQNERSGHLAPGEVSDVNKAGILVNCGQNSLYLIKELQPEGKKIMKAYVFSLGTKIESGDMFP